MEFFIQCLFSIQFYLAPIDVLQHLFNLVLTLQVLLQCQGSLFNSGEAPAMPPPLQEVFRHYHPVPDLDCYPGRKGLLHFCLQGQEGGDWPTQEAAPAGT